MRTSPLRWVATAALTLSVAATAACGGDPLSSGGGGGNGDPNSIIVGSANFPESEIVANLYSEVLRANGFDVSEKFNIGTREAYIPALRDGSIDVTPDYTGNLLQYLDKEATSTAPDDVDTDLNAALGTDLGIAKPAPAEDKDAVVVTKETADRWQLKTIADLAPHSSDVKFGAPAEFQERAVGLPGLKKNYGLDVSPGNFVPIADGGGPATIEALASGQVTAADIFTTTPAIKARNFVVLEDPKNNFPAQNVVPVIRVDKKTQKLVKVLNSLSAKLTTPELFALNEEVSGDAKTEPKDAAKAWITKQGLDKPLG
ncbi:ABC transporter substrate-binding protein [Antrihabitans cavernicola]|uniref:ABC transporter substrate-binding protein n=1 Tax=Antrihabitans cavernicola TaxID=2495913 RepID=A0A5A7S8S5_9NOCA|nr:ABC transporter substrate-binding protein [Spelaeibacter cavernicola]KAA0022540.1 ABC transporter substrate-binding protein [Spelaeibacter cavernicola]